MQSEEDIESVSKSDIEISGTLGPFLSQFDKQR
jgi:hypothetical protein